MPHSWLTDIFPGKFRMQLTNALRHFVHNSQGQGRIGMDLAQKGPLIYFENSGFSYGPYAGRSNVAVE